MTPPVLYMVRVWVAPDGGERYLRWLEEKHMAEVIREPGFLWASKYALEQTDDKGWRSYLLLYGLETRAALDAYLDSDSRKRFWEELKPLNDVHYAERFYGSLDFEARR
jgi:antibiotic biosynthesis monooxygenase (ABM) superfamily enzyme